MQRTVLNLAARVWFLLLVGLGAVPASVAAHWTEPYNISWTSPSRNSAGSMPVGGHDIGLNVWVENGDVLFYIERSGSFDENNQMLKLGRMRLTLTPNPFGTAGPFRQTLNLHAGAIEITGGAGTNAATVKIWVEVARPVIHAEITAQQPVMLATRYENWRTRERELSTPEREAAYSFAGTSPADIRIVTHPDTFEPGRGEMLWYHRNDNSDLVFDKEVTAQHLESVRAQLWNPQKDFTFGGLLRTKSNATGEVAGVNYLGTAARAWRFDSAASAREHSVTVYLHAAQTSDIAEWKKGLAELADAAQPTAAGAWQSHLKYWDEFWDRSHILLDPGAAENNPLWVAGRNYQLFRFQLGCNSTGACPTKFNGGLFTFDPVLVNPNRAFPPDFRRWGGGSFTLQNQRLVYWPMLKAGDFELMRPQFEFCLRALTNAELRTRLYWNHGGASFTEQMEDYGLPTGDIYEKSWGNRPLGPRPGDDFGSLTNNWCQDEYDTVIEFALMIVDYEQFTGRDIARYLPLLNSVVEFFDQHYRYQHKLRTGAELDAEGHLVIFPGSAGESYKVATNPTSTASGLRTLLTRMMALPAIYGTVEQRARWQQMLDRIPPLEFREMEGRKTIAPAKNWERINNTEIPQLYPVFPYGIYGVGKPDLQVAIDTYDFGVDRGAAARGVNGWRQDPIWMARLGLADRAGPMVLAKLASARLRFPTFWGPNFDWTPDFNHGGSAMIALQEMLLQTDGLVLRLLPAWPKDWNVDFRLCAPYQTTVEGVVKEGKLVSYKITPVERTKDVIIPDAWK